MHQLPRMNGMFDFIWIGSVELWGTQVELSWISCLTSQLTIFQSYMWRKAGESFKMKNLQWDLNPRPLDYEATV